MLNKIKDILTKKEIAAIEEYECLLVEAFPKRLRKIILFGSKARGDAHRGSDLDLLVVVSRNGRKVKQEIAGLTHLPIAHFLVDLSPIIVEESFFKEWSPLLAHIKKEGITLWTNKNKKNM